MNILGDTLPRRFKAKASGAIAAGKPLIVETDGDVAQVGPSAQAVGTPVIFEDGYMIDDTASVFDPVNNKIVIAYQDYGNSLYGTAVVGTVDASDNSISYGTPVVFESAATDNIGIAYDSLNDKIFIVYADDGNSAYGTGIGGAVSGTSITFQTAGVYESAGTGDNSVAFDESTNVFLIAYRDVGDSNKGKVCTAHLDSTSPTYGSPQEFESGFTRHITATYVGSGSTVVSFADFNDSDKGKAIVATIDASTRSNPTASFGSIVVFASGGSVEHSQHSAYDSNADRVVIPYRDGNNSGYGTAVVGTVSGTSISFGTPVVFESADSRYNAAVYDSDASKINIAYADWGNSKYGTAITGTVSGTSISFETATVFESAQADNISAAFDSNQNRTAIAYNDDGNSDKGTGVVYQGVSSNLTSENYIGIAEYAAADTETATVFIKGGVSTPGGIALSTPEAGTAAEFESGAIGTFTASVYDPDTNRIIVAYNDAGDSDKGKAAVGTVSGTSISFGTPVEFEAGGTTVGGITYDTNENRVVINYADSGNSSYGTAIVGTVSGTSISFGTAVVYNSGESTEQGITFDSSNNKVVICYRDNANSNHGTAIVGTVSGTSISFGSEVSYNAANSTNNTATFDSSNNKVVIAYRDGGNSNYGTAIVGTVSGTSISFGSEVVFAGSSAVQYNSAVFDSSNNKVVIAYRDDGNSSYGTAIVGTVSGTSISFGTAVVFASSTTIYTKAAFDSGLNQIGIVWRDGGDADALDFRVGTVSGTSISFGTSIELAGDVEQSPIAYDSSSGQFVVAYHDDGDSSKGKAVVVSTLFSMTPGQTYFVQGNGTLGLTAGSPSVTAGTAVTSTKLIVKG